MHSLTQSTERDMSAEEKHLYDHFQSLCIRINVGKDAAQRSFFAHKTLIEAKSEFFRAALKSNFAEAKDGGEVNLPDDNPEVFHWILKWVYGAPLRLDDVPSPSLLMEIYIAADKLMCRGLQNTMTDIAQEYYSENIIRFCELQLLVDRNLSDSKLVKYLTTQVAFELARHYERLMTRNSWAEFISLGPETVKMIMDEADNFRPLKDGVDDPAQSGGYQFHEHGKSDTEDCRRCKGDT